ncbi:hypothetical protein ACVWZ4_000992 [Bradyrhizobium sp. USDA 4472]
MLVESPMTEGRIAAPKSDEFGKIDNQNAGHCSLVAGVVLLVGIGQKSRDVAALHAGASAPNSRD